MNRDEFFKELEKYPIIRTKNYQYDWNTSIKFPEVKKEGSKAVETKENRKRKFSDDFWSSLQIYVSEYYPKTKAEEIVSRFRSSYSKQMISLSLDDIEFLVPQFVASTNETFPASS